MSDHESRDPHSKESTSRERTSKEADFFGMFPFGMFPPGIFPPFGMYPFFGLALPLWWSQFVFPFLDWQRVMLTAWQKALEDPTFAKLPEDELRRRMKLAWRLYLEGHRFREELGDEVVNWQSDLVEAWLEMIKGVTGSVERRTMG
jgi:hypothetical protein